MRTLCSESGGFVLPVRAEASLMKGLSMGKSGMVPVTVNHTESFHESPVNLIYQKKLKRVF